MHGYGVKNIADGTFYPSIQQLALLSLMAFPVDSFVFISGFYGIKLKKEKALRMLLQASYFFLLCIILRNIFHIGPNIPHGIILINALPITNRAWWFLAWYFMLMLLSPIIEAGIRGVDISKLGKILVCVIAINCVGTWVNGLHSGSDFVGLLTIYLMGRYVGLSDIHVGRLTSSFSLLLSTAILVVLLCVALRYDRLYFVWILLSLCNPLIVIQAISVFYLTKSLPGRPCRICNFLGAHCFGIYLLTEFTGNHFYIWWRHIYESQGLTLLLISVLSLCIAACILDYIGEKVFLPVKRVMLRII